VAPGGESSKGGKTGKKFRGKSGRAESRGGGFVIKGSVSGKTGYSFECPIPYVVVEKQWGLWQSSSQLVF
jgi:hypothetical protein